MYDSIHAAVGLRGLTYVIMLKKSIFNYIYTNFLSQKKKKNLVQILWTLKIIPELLIQISFQIILPRKKKLFYY